MLFRSRTVESDYVAVPCYDIANSIDWNIKYSRDARWNILGRAMEVLEAGFVKIAKSYSNRKGISYTAWRAVGVQPNVLKKAGIPRSS